jgi:hypothetical protein
MLRQFDILNVIPDKLPPSPKSVESLICARLPELDAEYPPGVIISSVPDWSRKTANQSLNQNEENLYEVDQRTLKSIEKIEKPASNVI